MVECGSKHYMDTLHSFEPIATSQSCLLILGSMPSATSLSKNEYYGHPRNAFWPILADLFNHSIATYADKIDLLQTHKIALWDVLSECTRIGSADASIRDVKPNDLHSFLSLLPSLRMIICNGTLAMRLFLRFGPSFENVVQCPSTSAANTMAISSKAEAWTTMIKRGLEIS